MTSEQKEFYYNYYIDHGLDPDTAEIVVNAWDTVSLDSPRRIYNDMKLEKDREAQEHMKKTFSPNKDQRKCYEVARNLRMAKETNLHLF
jgi:hypothetical protein